MTYRNKHDSFQIFTHAIDQQYDLSNNKTNESKMQQKVKSSQWEKTFEDLGLNEVNDREDGHNNEEDTQHEDSSEGSTASSFFSMNEIVNACNGVPNYDLIITAKTKTSVSVLQTLHSNWKVKLSCLKYKSLKKFELLLGIRGMERKSKNLLPNIPLPKILLNKCIVN